VKRILFVDDEPKVLDGLRRMLYPYRNDWQMVFVSSAAEALLFRLFHEDGVRAHAPHRLAARCRCSRQRVETVLRALKPDELDDMKIGGRITVTCEFCSTVYAFDDEALEALAVS